jgi:hypothetical protein
VKIGWSLYYLFYDLQLMITILLFFILCKDTNNSANIMPNNEKNFPLKYIKSLVSREKMSTFARLKTRQRARMGP